MTVTTCYPSDTDWGTFNWETATQEQTTLRDLAEEFAWGVLDGLTAGAIATCPVRVRPAKWSCSAGSYYLAPAGAATGPFNPYIGVDGLWRNEAHGWECGCNDARIVTLAGTVGSIEYVQVDGRNLPPTAYRVDDGNRLIRVDGKGWPLRQDMYATAGDTGTFVVSYYSGRAPDRLDKFAAGVLAKEFLKAQAGDKSCRLPKGTTQITRNGTSVTLDPALFSTIPEVGQIVLRHNPHRLKAQSAVYSPDTLYRNPITTYSSADRSSGMRESMTVVAPPATPDSELFGVTATGTLVPDPDNPGFYITKEN